MPPITEHEIKLVAIAIAIGFGLLVTRWLYFNAKIKAANRCREEYLRVLEEVSKGQRDFKHYDRLAEVEARFTRLMMQAKSYPTGFILKHEPEMFGEFGPSPSMVRTYLQSFHTSIGYFQARKSETFSIVCWIDTLINWPRIVLGKLGFDRNGSIANLLKIAALILEIFGFILLVWSRAQQIG